MSAFTELLTSRSNWPSLPKGQSPGAETQHLHVGALELAGRTRGTRTSLRMKCSGVRDTGCGSKVRLSQVTLGEPPHVRALISPPVPCEWVPSSWAVSITK